MPPILTFVVQYPRTFVSSAGSAGSYAFGYMMRFDLQANASGRSNSIKSLL